MRHYIVNRMMYVLYTIRIWKIWPHYIFRWCPWLVYKKTWSDSKRRKLVTNLDDSSLCYIVIRIFPEIQSSMPVPKYAHEINQMFWLSQHVVQSKFNYVNAYKSTLINGCSYRYFDINYYGLYGVMIYMYELYKYWRNI